MKKDRMRIQSFLVTLDKIYDLITFQGPLTLPTGYKDPTRRAQSNDANHASAWPDLEREAGRDHLTLVPDEIYFILNIIEHNSDQASPAGAMIWCTNGR